MIGRPSDPAAVARLRSICERLPDVSERLSHGDTITVGDASLEIIALTPVLKAGVRVRIAVDCS